MKKYGLIGFPLVQSFSQKYFNDKFSKEAIHDCLFDLYPIESVDDFTHLLAREPLLKGLAVTIPYKEAIIPFLSSLDVTAQAVGAVNCITIHDKHTIGYNTDCLGFEKSFVPLLTRQHTKALILGTGGASKAVQFVLEKIGMEYMLVSRNPSREDGIICYPDIDAHLLHSYPVIINCTPLGMVPHETTFPLLPYEFLSNKNLLYDLVYKPAQTLFLKYGAEKGALVKNGMDMLLIQAAENWRIWRLDH